MFARTPRRVLAAAAAGPGEGGGKLAERVVRRYHDLKRDMGYLDFDDLLFQLGARDFFRGMVHVPRWIPPWHSILEELHRRGLSLTAIGDDAQSIYGLAGSRWTRCSVEGTRQPAGQSAELRNPPTWWRRRCASCAATPSSSSARSSASPAMPRTTAPPTPSRPSPTRWRRPSDAYGREHRRGRRAPEPVCWRTNWYPDLQEAAR